MLNSLKKVRDKYMPGLKIHINEWGPSYHVNSTPQSMINANHIGAAWSIKFLNAMLENGVDSAMFLVTTDLMQVKKGKRKNVWGWCSFFVNPKVYGQAYPKAPYHIFDMIARLNGKRIEATRDGNINSFAVANPKTKKIQLIIWNFAVRIPESGMPVDFAITENVGVTVRKATRFFGSDKVKISRMMVSKTHANAFQVFKAGGKLTMDNTGMKILDRGEYSIVNGLVSAGFNMPPSSIAFIEIETVK
jgi:xylan 1,4-beta-xylosidase